MSAPLYVGIDLGTSNSAAAVFDGEKVEIVRNATGSTLTPSVVRIDSRGRTNVGSTAQRRLHRDPGNVKREFKRLMGTTQRIEFQDSGESRLPEELSALLLQALRKDVEDVVGVLPTRAVISVPALFELPQNKATSQAANLAGFEQVELLQEPIASALAAGWNDDESGSWMVYDLGGGTFDVSLLETRDGLLRIVGHDGDNFLGGRDFDRAIVDWIIDQLAEQGVQIDRKDPTASDNLALLGHAAEAAKIALSRAEEVDIQLDDPIIVAGEDVDIDLRFSRSAMEEICQSLVERSIDVCKRLLSSSGIGTSQLSRIVLVGGPSVMPMVRREIETRLETKVAEGYDPMTLVAQGAALFAATAGLNARPSSSASETDTDGRRVWCQFPPVTADLAPFVIGRFDPKNGALPKSIALERVSPADPSWKSDAVPLDEDHAFVIAAELIARKQNRFSIVCLDDDGVRHKTIPSEISIIQGLSLGDPPLSRSIGVALANDSVHTYFDRGTALPARRTFTHNTIEPLIKGNNEATLAIPIVQGEYDQAHLCRLVGELRISGENCRENIPSGTAVEMTLDLDRGGKLSANARIQIEGKSDLLFEGVAQLIMASSTPESLRAGLKTAVDRIGEAQSAAFRDAQSSDIQRLSALSLQVERVEQLIDSLVGGDADAGQQAARVILDIDADLAAIDAEQRWPEISNNALHTFAWAMDWAGEYARESEMRMLDRAGTGLNLALEERNVVEVLRQARMIRRIGGTCYRRNPDCWRDDFDYCLSVIDEMSDLREAKALEKKGKAALKSGDVETLRSTVKRMWVLMPPDQESRRMSFESGVR